MRRPLYVPRGKYHASSATAASNATRGQIPVLKYDEGSGALYTETIIKSDKDALEYLDHRPSLHHATLLSIRCRKAETTLFNLARRATLKISDCLTVDVLKEVPWIPIGKLLWEDLIYTGGDTFTIFTAFVTVYGTEPDFHPGNLGPSCSQSEPIAEPFIKRRILNLPMSMAKPWTPSYIPYLSSFTFSFLVNLYIIGTEDQIDLLELAELPNLVSLTLSLGTSIELRSLNLIFRSWARKSLGSAKSTSFQKLKSIRLRAIPVSLFFKDLSHLIQLSRLPALKLIQIDLASKLDFSCAGLDEASPVRDGWISCCSPTGCKRCISTLSKHEHVAVHAISMNEEGKKVLDIWKFRTFILTHNGKDQIDVPIVDVLPVGVHTDEKEWYSSVFYCKKDIGTVMSVSAALGNSESVQSNKRSLPSHAGVTGEVIKKGKIRSEKMQNITSIFDQFNNK